MSRLLFCTAKIVNVDKNAESQDEMRKKQTGLLKQRMLRKSCLFHLKFEIRFPIVATIKAKSKMSKNVAIKNVSVQIYNFSLF